MAKKILYKVTAYHCPRCGGVTKPTKKYCDYCSRDLNIRREKHNCIARMLIDCGEYVFFDEIKQIETFQTPSIDCTTLEDSRRICIKGAVTDNKISVVMDTNTDRSRELLSLAYNGIHKVRFELLGADLGFEQECYISDIQNDVYSPRARLEQKINFVGIGEMKQGGAIPQEVLAEFRCPNCGAPILSRYGACDYCSGWSEILW